MFTQSCFIRKNTQELRTKLEEMGYGYAPNGIGEWHIPIEDLSYLGVNLYSGGKYMGVNGKWDSHWIDCGTNEKLFLAIAALRDDSDKYQRFKHNAAEVWIKCEKDKFSYSIYDRHNDIDRDITNRFHKATPQELIEHFKDK